MAGSILVHLIGAAGRAAAVRSLGDRSRTRAACAAWYQYGPRYECYDAVVAAWLWCPVRGIIL
eukprot:COSAG03_NODE_391_length_8292_cov_18.368607_2_plen_63_part_00